MHFDRPAALSTAGLNERRGSAVIDPEARELPQKPYPKPYSAHTRTVSLGPKSPDGNRG